MSFDDGLAVDQRIIGKGFGFPMGVDARGNIRMSRGAEDIEEAIRLILGTAPGERRMRPEFGCNLHEVVFSPMDATTMTMIRYHVTEALQRWEPRIELNDVRVEPSTDLDGCLLIHVGYTVRATLDRRTL